MSDVPGENEGAAEGAAEEAQTELGEQWEQDARAELVALKAKGDDATEDEKARIAELEERFTAGSGPPAA